MRRAALALVLIALPMLSAGEESAMDPETGLVIADGFAEVRAHCGACHGHALVTAQRGDRAFWLGLIRWMQETQNLWPLDERTEGRILDYLATNYGSYATGRRRPLPPELLPPAGGDAD